MATPVPVVATPAPAAPSPTPPLPPSPEPPANLRLVEVSSSQVTVKWDFSANVSYYRVYRNSKAVATEHTFPDYYIFTDLSPGAEYVFGVQAINASGASRIVTIKQEVPYKGRSGNSNF